MYQFGGVKFNLYSFKINGKKYGIGDDVTGTYYGYYDNFVVFNALFLVDYPLKYISDNDFLKNVTVTGYTGLSYFYPALIIGQDISMFLPTL